RRIGGVKVGEATVGNRTRVKVVKNKLAPPFQQVEFDIRFGEGCDVVSDLLDTAVAQGVVEKSGAYHSFEGSSLGQGREKARLALLEDGALRERLARAVYGKPEPAPAKTDAKAEGGKKAA